MKSVHFNFDEITCIFVIFSEHDKIKQFSINVTFTWITVLNSDIYYI